MQFFHVSTAAAKHAYVYDVPVAADYEISINAGSSLSYVPNIGALLVPQDKHASCSSPVSEAVSSESYLSHS